MQVERWPEITALLPFHDLFAPVTFDYDLTELSLEEVARLENDAERLVAEFILAVADHLNLQVSLYQEPCVNGRHPDFLVCNEAGQGFLVEVTITPEAKLDDCRRKRKQIKAMKATDMPYLVLCQEDVETIAALMAEGLTDFS